MIDRRGRELPLDAHLHTDQSPDSDAPIDAYAEGALELGIAELAITDHIDFAPGTPAYHYVAFSERERVVRDAADRWAERGVAIRFGAEVTWDAAWEGDIREHLRTHPYDFLIGSVHVYAGSPYDPPNVAAWVAGKTLPEIVGPYFEQVVAAARSELFDTMGHLDVIKRYLMPYVTPTDFAGAPELYEPMLRALVESGTSLEINTRGLRHEPRETYPAAPIIARYRELGGRGITIGSDAHGADAFAFGLGEGYEIASATGFSELTFRRGADPVSVPFVHAPNAMAGRSL